MATSSSTCKLIKLNGDNHPAWKLQLRMALIWDDLWDIMNSSEKPPVGEAATADARKKIHDLQQQSAVDDSPLHGARAALSHWKRTRRSNSCLETTHQSLWVQDLGELLWTVEAIDHYAQDERERRRRIGRCAPEIAARNLWLPGSSRRSSLREKARDVHTCLFARIIPTMVTALAASTEDVPSLADMKENSEARSWGRNKQALYLKMAKEKHQL